MPRRPSRDRTRIRYLVILNRGLSGAKLFTVNIFEPAARVARGGHRRFRGAVQPYFLRQSRRD